MNKSQDWETGYKYGVQESMARIKELERINETMGKKYVDIVTVMRESRSKIQSLEKELAEAIEFAKYARQFHVCKDRAEEFLAKHKGETK